VAFPGLGNFQGLLGWTQLDQWQREVQRAEARYEPVFAAYRDKSIEQIAADPQAVRMGQRLFANNCSQCHGSDARGSIGFPNLTDADWIWGGTPEAIQATLVNGRQAAMPPWEAALGDQGVTNVARYVRTLSGAEPASAESAAGEAQFKMLCVACHGADGKGNQMLGAPNLADNIWLYGGDLETIKQTLRKGRNGKMPAFGEQLNEDRIRLLTAYVYSLSSQ